MRSERSFEVDPRNAERSEPDVGRPEDEYLAYVTRLIDAQDGDDRALETGACEAPRGRAPDRVKVSRVRRS